MPEVNSTSIYTATAVSGLNSVPNSCVDWTWSLSPLNGSVITFVENQATIVWGPTVGTYTLKAIATNNNTTLLIEDNIIINTTVACVSSWLDTGVIACGQTLNNTYGLSLDICKEYKQQKDSCNPTVFQYIDLGNSFSCPGCNQSCIPFNTVIRYDNTNCIVCEDPSGSLYQTHGTIAILADGNCGEINGTTYPASCGSDIEKYNC
jgi:hypothetical protein